MKYVSDSNLSRFLTKLKGLFMKKSDLVANPTLAGTESDLTGLQVGDTKYKVGGGGHLYQHNVAIGTSSVLGQTQILTTFAEPFTKASLAEWLYANYSLSAYYDMFPMMFGYTYSAPAFGFSSENGASLKLYYWSSANNIGSTPSVIQQDYQLTIFKDTVKQIM